MTWYREWFGEDYLDLYSYRDEEEAKLQAGFFKTHVGSVKGKVLDLACGTGRHIHELGKHGYHVIGFDLSWILLRRGITSYGAMPLVRADMRTLPFCDGTFAGLVNFFTSFGYFESEDDNANTVHEMARVLEKSAPFLFDYLNVQRELDKMVQRESRRIDETDVEIERWFDGASRTFNKRITMGDRRYLERVRGYDLDEISTLFAAAGFSIRDVYGDFDGSPFRPDSPRLILTGMRRR